MKNRSSLRRSWLYAGAVLLVFCLLAHLTSAYPAGGVAGAFGTLIVTLAQIVMLAVGLVIGIAICIAVMLGIYVASAHLLGGEELGRATSLKVRRAVAEKLRDCGLCRKHTPESGAESPIVSVVPQTRECVDTQALSAAISANAEQTAAVMHEVEKVGAAVRVVEERSRERIAAEIAPLKERLDQLAQRCEALEVALKAVNGMPARIDAQERQLANFAALPQQMGDLQNALRPLQEGLEKLQASLKAKPEAEAPKKSEQPKPRAPRAKKS